MHILVGLEPFEQAARKRRPADRLEHAGGGNQRRIAKEGGAHRGNRAGLQQGIGIDCEHDIGARVLQRLIERTRLAAMGQAQPLQASGADHGFGHPADAGRGEAISLQHHGGGGIARPVVGNEDSLGRLGLREKAIDREVDDARLVVRSDDDAQGRCIGGMGHGPGGIGHQFADLPRGEQQQRGIVKDIGDADRPHAEVLALERLEREHDKEKRRGNPDQSADERHRARGEPRRLGKQNGVEGRHGGAHSLAKLNRLLRITGSSMNI